MAPYQEKTVIYPRTSTPNFALRIVMATGIAGGLLLIIYFLIVKAMGLHTQPELRWINFILIIPFAVYSINKYINKATAKTYLKALIVSAGTIITAYFVLGVFMVTYLFTDTAFMNYLYEQALPQLQLNQGSIMLLLMFEGVVAAVILSFVILQFFKDRIRNAA